MTNCGIREDAPGRRLTRGIPEGMVYRLLAAYRFAK